MTIYFLTPDFTFASGGVRVIYRHVDILNAYGIPAYVVHSKPGFRCAWFKNNTLVTHLDKSLWRMGLSKIKKYFNMERPYEMYLQGSSSPKIGSNDYLVLPEMHGPLMVDMAPGVPKVILNQNCYLSFQGYSLQRDAEKTPYGHPEFKAVLINSADGEAYLNHVFPQIPITRFHLSIDPELFLFQANKKRQICFTPRKNELVVRQVINILKHRRALSDFELIPFAGISQREVARIMQESAIFLSFGQYEGFGLPPAEAMACGCIVIGFHAGGGQEFFKPEFSYPVEYGDILGYARTVEQVIQAYDAEPEQMAAMARTASEYVTTRYSKQQEEADVVGFWRKMLGRHDNP